MIIDKKVIDGALIFYNIDDNDYKQKCYDVIDEINNNDEFINKANDIYNRLYIDENYNIRRLWKTKSKEELFGKISSPYITNVILLMGYKVHEKNMNKYNLDKYQISAQKKRVKDALLNDIKIKGYDGIRISQMLWGAWFVNLMIIEVGRLQYELFNANPLNENEYKICIKIHIPAGDKLDINLVKESIKNSKKEIKKYFKIEDPEYYCSSWMLSKQVKNIVSVNSNIAKFYELFDVVEKEDCKSDILNFVFGNKECNDFSKLQEDTSLQIKLKKLLLANADIIIGVGKLRKLVLN